MRGSSISQIRAMTRQFSVAGLLWLASLTSDGLHTQATDASEVRWDMSSFERTVKPMRHSLKGRLPLFVWNFPLPRGADLVRMRDDGTLRRAIDQLAVRGIVPTVEMGWEWTPPGALAMARTLKEAGQPVYLLIPDAQLIERDAYAHTRIWIDGPDGSGRGRTRKWPCLPLADPHPSAGRVRELIRPYKAAGIPVKGVWFDDEALPHPWNGVHEAQRTSRECRRHYPGGVVDQWPSFVRYVYQLRTRLLDAVMADPVHALFPGALAGNYYEAPSSAAVPFVDEAGNVFPPRAWGRLDALMPSAYANTVHLARHAGAGRAVTQETADRLYFFRLLRTISTANANKSPGKLSIAFVSRFVPDDPAEHVRFGLNPRLYRELIRHALLRGTDGLYLFNLGYPGSPVTPAESFESVEDARAAYDELLAHREFLERGRPMTYQPPPEMGGVVWSGLRLGDRCLVRVFSLGSAAGRVDLVPFPGIRVTAEAPMEGATYIIRKDGTVIPSQPTTSRER
jgi:hypothetical protein